MTRSNGVVTSYTYDQDSRIASITDAAGATTLASIVLSRDAIGRATSAARFIPQEAALASSSTSSVSFGAANEISGATYDARGRLTNDNSGATYQWSASSRLLSYARPDGSASAITYDGLGQRISRTSGGTTQNYVVDYATGLPSVAIIESGGSPLTYYVYTGEGSLLYSVDATSGAHRFYAYDDTGSTTFLTNDAGTITDTYGISPYGDVVTAGPGNSTANPFTWQGQMGVMQDAGTKLYYARFRYYDSGTARFLSRDPLFSPAPREVNPYQYAAGDPVANGDPMGLKPKPNFVFSTLDGTISGWNNSQSVSLSGDVAAVAPTPAAPTAVGFQGYIIAQSSFQYNHSYAFIGALGIGPKVTSGSYPAVATTTPPARLPCLRPEYEYTPFFKEFGLSPELGLSPLLLGHTPTWQECLYFPPQPGGQK
jgi:RHS repeat-associated protein